MAENGNGSQVGKVLRGVHVGATITLALFIYQQWEIGRERDQLQREKIAVLAEQVRQLQDPNTSAIDAINTTRIDELARRLASQQAEMMHLRESVVEHMQRDEQRFRGKP